MCWGQQQRTQRCATVKLTEKAQAIDEAADFTVAHERWGRGGSTGKMALLMNTAQSIQTLYQVTMIKG